MDTLTVAVEPYAASCNECPYTAFTFLMVQVMKFIGYI